jgi:pyruvate dehydrogenase E2 component (dihydrolipoamide acetyltransferase)
MLVVDPSALGSALARTTLRQRQERPLAAQQRRLAQSVLAGGRQAFDVRGLLAAPRAPTKIVFGIEDRITPAHHAEGLSGLIALHRFPGGHFYLHEGPELLDLLRRSLAPQ